MPLGNKLKGQIFTVTNRLHHYFGRTFEVIGYWVDKFGGKYVLCEDVNESGYKSSYLFNPKELIA